MIDGHGLLFCSNRVAEVGCASSAVDEASYRLPPPDAFVVGAVDGIVGAANNSSLGADTCRFGTVPGYRFTDTPVDDSARIYTGQCISGMPTAVNTPPMNCGNANMEYAYNVLLQNSYNGADDASTMTPKLRELCRSRARA